MVEEKGLKYKAKTKAKQALIATQEALYRTVEAIRAATAIRYDNDASKRDEGITRGVVMMMHGDNVLMVEHLLTDGTKCWSLTSGNGAG